MTFDRRITPAREDLASEALEGLVRAPRFVEPRPMRVAGVAASLRAAADPWAEQRDALVFGERFDVLAVDGRFAWGQAVRDGYVGYVEASALSADLVEPTHRVRALRTFAFAQPSIKTRPFGPISLNALVAVIGEEAGLLQVEGAGWIAARHLAPIGDDFEPPADVAERFVGTPYLWGGRDSLGIDCSGLVQQALYAAGLACPRDSDQQAGLGDPVDRADLARGDLVFWRGHVGMMLDETLLVHANAHHMAVAVEPLDAAASRIADAGGGEPTALRRLARRWRQAA
jgi:cell wall-associated NlpC family hydrolase